MLGPSWGEVGGKWVQVGPKLGPLTAHANRKWLNYTLSYIWNVPTYIMGLYIYMAYICLWIINHLLSGMHIQVGVPFGVIKRG